MPLLIPQRIWASTDKWSGTLSNWSTTTGWSLNHQPGNLDTAQIVGGSNSTNILTFDSAATATNLSVLWIDAAKVSTSITLSQVTNSLTTGLEIIGYTNSATLSLSGGTQTIGGLGSNALYLGFTPNSTGNVNISAGTLQVLNTFLDIGYAGSGNVTQSGGTVLLSGSGTNGLIVGDNNAATYTLSGGLLSVSNGATTIGLNSGLSSTFNQTGGSNITGTLDIGLQKTAYYTLSNGASLTVNGNTTIGDDAAGSFTHFGGNASFNGDVQVGNIAGSYGVLSQTGGAASVSGNLLLGVQGGSFGSVGLSGGSLNAGGVYIGGNSNAAGGTGMLGVNGGNLTTVGPLKLYISNTANSLALSGGGAISAGSVDLGGNFSRFNWTAGTLLISGSNGLNIDGSSPVGGSWTIGTSQNLTVNYSESVGSSTNGGAFMQTGGNHSVLGALTIASGVGASGTYTLSGGVLSAAVTDNGTFTQNGGTFTGSLSVNNTFNFTAGTFNGTLTIGLGANANFTGPFTTSSTIAVSGNATVGASATLNTAAGFDSEGGAVTLTGGTMGGAGPLLNNGLITGFGVISGSGGFTNNSTINQGAGNLTMANTGPSINNSAINLVSGRQLIVSATYSNAGSITLNGAIISGTSSLINTPTGSLNGPGMISAPLSNSGNVIIDSGTLSVPTVFTNNGNIQLGGLTAAFNGSGVVNANELQGFGTVGAPVTNNATIASVGGTLTFSSAVNNTATGTLQAASGTKILLSGGLASNAGLIGLSGGTVDSGAQYIVNSGQISGFGILSSAGLTNAAGATITLGGGTASIYGTLTNNIGGTVRVNECTAIFQGPVINNGFMQVIGANVTFAGGFTDNGIYSSDPSIHTLTNLTIGKSGALIADGDTFIVSGNFLSSSTQSAVWDTRHARLEFTGAGVHAMSVTGDIGDFAWGTLRLDDNAALSLADGNSNPGGGLYVDVLDLADAPTDGTLAAFIAAHLVNADAADPMDLYYNPSESADAYLDGQTYPLGNGGFLAPAVLPEPSAVLLLGIGAGACLTRRRRISRPATNSPV